MNVSLDDLLTQVFGLEKDDATIYSVLLIFGVQTQSELSKMTGLPEPRVKTILQKLVELQLVIKLDGKLERFFALPPYQSIAKNVYKAIENIKSTTEDFQPQVKEKLTTLDTQFDGLVKNVGAKIRQNAKTIEKASETAKSSIITSIQESKKTSKDVREKLEVTGKLLDELVEELTIFNDKLAKTFDKAISELLEETATKITPIKEDIVSIVETKINASVDTIVENISSTLRIFSETTKNMKSKNDEFASALKSTIVAIENDTTETTKKVDELISGISSDTATDISNFVSSVNKVIATKTRNTKKKYRETLEKIDTDIARALNESISSITNSILSSFSDAKKIIAESEQTVYEKIEGTTVTLDSKIENSLSGLSTNIEELNKAIQKHLESEKGFFEENIDILTKATKDVLKEMKEEVKTIISPLGDKIPALLKTVELDAQKINENILELLSKSIEEHISTIKEGKTEFSTRLENLITDAVTKYGEHIAEVTRTLEVKTKNIHAEITSKIDELEEFTDKQLEEFQNKIIEDHKKTYLQVVETLKGGFERGILNTEKIREVLNSYFDKQLSDMETILERGKRELLSSIVEHKELIQKNYQLWYDGVNQFVENMINQFTSFMTSMQQSMVGYLEDEMKTVSDSLNSAIGRFTTTIESYLDKSKTENEELKNELFALLDRYKADLEQIENGTLSEYEKVITTHQEGTKRLTTALKDATVEHLKNSEILLLTSYSKNINEIGNTLQNEASFLRAGLEELVQGYNSKLDENIESLENKLMEFDENISNQIESYLQMLGENVSKQERAVKRILSSTLENLDIHLKDVEKNVEDTTLQSLNKYDENYNQLIKSTSELFEKSNNLIETSKSDINVALNTVINDVKDSLDSTVNDLSSMLDELKETAEQTYKEGVVKASEDVAEIYKQHTKDIEDILSTINVEISRNLNELQKGLIETLDRNLKNTAGIANNSIISVKDRIVSQATNIINWVEESATTIDSIDKTTNEKIKATMDQLVETNKEVREDIAKMIENKTDEVIITIKQTLEETNKGLLESSSTLVNKNISNVSQRKETYQTIVKSTYENLMKSFEDTEGSITKLFDVTLDKIKNNSEKTVKSVTKTIDTSKTKISRSISSLVEEIVNSIAEMEKEYSTAADQIKNAWNTYVEAIKRRPIHSWEIYGKELIENHIIDMIKRATEYFAIIMPIIDDNIKDALEELSEPALVEVITTTKTDEEIVNRLNKAKNIRVWQISKELELISALRDEEEFIFAPVAEEPNDMVGFVSLTPGGVKLFKVALAPAYIRKGKSKRFIEVVS